MSISSQNVISIDVLTRGHALEQRRVASLSSAVDSSSVTPPFLTASDLCGILQFVPYDRMTLSTTRCVSKTWRWVLECEPSMPFGQNSSEMFHSRHGQQTVFNQRRCGPSRPLCIGNRMLDEEPRADAPNTSFPSAVGDSDADRLSSNVSPAPSSTSSSSSAGSLNGEEILSAALPAVRDGVGFSLYSVNPVGRKFRDHTAKILARNYDLISVGLTKLQLHHADITNDVFQHLKPIETLRDLQFVHCRDLTQLRGANELPALESLEVEMCGLDAYGVEGLFLPHLKRLVLRKCNRLESIHDMAPETAVGLLEFICEECPMVADDMATGFTGNLQSVEVLNMCCTATETVAGLIPPAGLSKLRVLDVSCSGITGEVLEAVATKGAASTLQVLRCCMCDGFLNALSLRQFSALTMLDLSANDLTHYEAIGSGLSAKSLVSLRIAESDALMDVNWLTSLVNLRIIDISSTSVNNAAVMSLSRLDALEMIILSNCGSVTSLNALATGCCCLKILLAGGSSVNDDGIISLSRCKSLEELDLNNTGVTMVSHLADLPLLRMLNVHRCETPVSELQKLLARGPDFELITDAFGQSLANA